ncbi:pyrroline-5-carboxylate reductase [Bacillus thermotolerans]|uniref:Pyrroline-5-carboxylate reductase n=1 Tax=Bacillus thermotolerans TaxID=1221996 RepID=A0A0F5HVX8_BACTR|nr:pyrroline-5-carboxylate reductase [Bacillus thermotolerans]KKB36217.1 Pyrroline-5-carboxylate reductase [Bacillus thermotolerans]KKB37205.1 Pyrroline-5-carboxylate reductase [Bacillus thermotolerans]KKB42839.1 Pyrroline-5-carboxylate reductase [Bacillus thermotolerans]
MKTAFIGAGSMAEAVITGAISSGALAADQIHVINKCNKERLEELKSRYGIHTSYDTAEILKDSHIVVLATKPKDAKDAIQKVKKHLSPSALIISLMAGVTIDFIAHETSASHAIIRAMPNTSATIGKSATAIALNEHVTEEQKMTALALFSSIGLTKIVKEEQLDAVTGLSGSGPAYIYYVAEAMEQAAEEIGLEKEVAKPLIIQTLLGAAEMLSATDGEAEQLRKAVMSPGGTTEAGIHILENKEVKQAFVRCITEATAQSKRLGLPYKNPIQQ